MIFPKLIRGSRKIICAPIELAPPSQNQPPKLERQHYLKNMLCQRQKQQRHRPWRLSTYENLKYLSDILSRQDEARQVSLTHCSSADMDIQAELRFQGSSLANSADGQLDSL